MNKPLRVLSAEEDRASRVLDLEEADDSDEDVRNSADDGEGSSTQTVNPRREEKLSEYERKKRKNIEENKAIMAKIQAEFEGSWKDELAGKGKNKRKQKAKPSTSR